MGHTHTAWAERLGGLLGPRKVGGSVFHPEPEMPPPPPPHRIYVRVAEVGGGGGKSPPTIRLTPFIRAYWYPPRFEGQASVKGFFDRNEFALLKKRVLNYGLKNVMLVPVLRKQIQKTGVQTLPRPNCVYCKVKNKNIVFFPKKNCTNFIVNLTKHKSFCTDDFGFL